MDNLPQYNLIQAIDPTKVKLPISDRFAKLTLSSNKKKQPAKNEQQLEGQQTVAQTEKRESISRNLLKQLSGDNVEDTSTEEDNSSSHNEEVAKNPLLRSESSKDTDINNTLTLENENETMEPLNVSEDESLTQLQLDEDLQALSQRIASMAVVSSPISRTISISSDSTDHLSELTQLVSTESQRSSIGDVNSLHIIRNINVNVAEAIKHDRISLNSEQAYEMTDDDDDNDDGEEGELKQNNVQEEEHEAEEEDDDSDDEDDDDDPITISDTTESHQDIEPDEMVTSSIPSTTQTSENLQLPCMTDDKAERVAAFLRDVSIERRVMEEHGHIEFNDTVDQILNNEDIDKISESLAKLRQIATADTESMTPDVGDEVTPISLIEREKRLKALDDSIGKHCKTPNKTIPHETQDNTILTEDDDDDEEYREQNKTPQISSNQNNTAKPVKNSEQDLETPKIPSNLNILNRLNSSNLLQNLENDHRRLAHDETQLNSEFSLIDLNKTPNIHSSLNSPKSYNSQKSYQNSEINQRRLHIDETQGNTDLPATESNKTSNIQSNLNSPNRYQSPKHLPIAEIDERRLAYNDTEENSEVFLTQINKTPKIPPNRNSPKRYNSPKRPQNKGNQELTLAYADTIINSKVSSTESNKTSKIHSNLNSSNRYISPQPQQKNRNQGHNLAEADTEINSENSSPPIIPNTPPNINSSKYLRNSKNAERNLATDETIANSLMTSINSSKPYDFSKDLKTPERDTRQIETEDNSTSSIACSSENLSDSIQQKSNNSIINSSSEHNSPAPQDSITILETDDEESVVSNNKSAQPSNNNSDDNKKLSNSFHNEDSLISISSSDDDQMSQIQISMAKINISAKINIKIHIPAQTSSTETSEDEDQNDEGDEQAENERQSVENDKSLVNDRTSSGNDKGSSENDRTSSGNDRTSSENSKKSLEIDRRSSENDRRNSENDRTSSGNDKTSSEDDRRSSENNKSLEIAKSLEAASTSIESHPSSKKQSNEKLLRPCNQLQLKPPGQTDCLSPLNISSDSDIEVVEDKKFFTEAERLLTQLYGNSWQTPDVMRTLKRSCQSENKKTSNSKTSVAKTKENLKNLKDDTSCSKSAVEESILDDFSMFRRNIVKTNLDSTRLGTPKPTNKQRLIKNKEISTEPRNVRTTSKLIEDKRIIPQTERKPFRTPVAKVAINKDRIDNNKWRQLIDHDSDSEGDNASDDDDADQSWSKNASEIEEGNSETDLEISPKPKSRNRKNTNSTKRRHRYNNGSDKLTRQLNKSKEGDIVYLDLSKEEVEVQEDVPESPPANHDARFATHLQDILKTCHHEDKAKLPSSASKTKRKLFTPNFGDDDLEGVAAPVEEPKLKENIAKLIVDDGILDDYNNCPFDSQGRPKILDLVNKQLESVKIGKPIFQLTPSPKKTTKNYKTKETATPKAKKDDNLTFKTPSTIKSKVPKALKDLSLTPDYKYSFLKSLDVQVSKSFCHPDALYYRENYRTKKEDLSKILYDMYNEKLFENKIDVHITWNKKLSNTAGRCLNKKKLGLRSSAIELSDKVLTSADRLRCTLIHELCHAATWILNGEGGHGSTWKEWARRANATFPEIPKIGVCHQYDIEYKYTYKCTLCAAKSHAHSKSKKVENIRCSYCHGAIEVFLNKKDKDGNIMPTPVREPTGFAKFVKDNYKKHKRDDRKHADVMKLLSSEFATLKLTTNTN